MSAFISVGFLVHKKPSIYIDETPLVVLVHLTDFGQKIVLASKHLWPADVELHKPFIKSDWNRAHFLLVMTADVEHYKLFLKHDQNWPYLLILAPTCVYFKPKYLPDLSHMFATNISKFDQNWSNFHISISHFTDFGHGYLCLVFYKWPTLGKFLNWKNNFKVLPVNFLCFFFDFFCH